MTAAILGFGESGQAAACYLKKLGVPLVVYERPDKVDALRAAHPDLTIRPLGEEIGEVEIWRSPGIRPDIAPIRHAVKRGAHLTGEWERFITLCPAPIYGVTGSDGKTTTATIAAELLRASGKRVWLGGNIGNSLLPVLDEIKASDAVVMELSSFQLMTLNAPIAAGVVTNITDNHLDWHRSREEYRAAKKRLLTYARRKVKHAALDDFPGLNFSAKCENANYCLQYGALFHGGNHLAYVKDVPLRGDYQIENLLAAIALTDATDRELRLALPRLTPIPHRNLYLGEYGGVHCYDSSIDTTPSRTAVTLSAHTRPLTVIVGGRGKAVPLAPLTDSLIAHADAVVCTGEMGEEMLVALTSDLRYKGSPRAFYVADFGEAVLLAHSLTPRGGTLLLSPAATSFDAFSSYKARGEAFEGILKTLI
jgi:UDP-N-acetylmuramoylalanine--D-glutamate ligase